MEAEADTPENYRAYLAQLIASPHPKMSPRHHQRHINQCRIAAAARYPKGSKGARSSGTEILVAVVLFVSFVAVLLGSR